MFDLSLLASFFVVGAIGIVWWITYKVYILPYYTSPLRKIPGPPSESLIYGCFKIFFAEEVSLYICNFFFNILMIKVYTLSFSLYSC